MERGAAAERRPASGALVTEPKDAPANLDDRQFARLKGELQWQYLGPRKAGPAI